MLPSAGLYLICVLMLRWLAATIYALLYLKLTVFYRWRTVFFGQYLLLNNHQYLLGTNANFSPILLVIAYHFFYLPESL